MIIMIIESFILTLFCISGSITFNYNKGAYNLRLDEGKFLTLYNPEKNLTIDASATKNSKVISVLIPIVEFHKLFSSSSSDIPFFENKSLNQKHYSESLISNSILIDLSKDKPFLSLFIKRLIGAFLKI